MLILNILFLFIYFLFCFNQQFILYLFTFKVKQIEKVSQEESLVNEEDMPEAVDIIALYKEILVYLLPKENIAKALKRLG